MVTNIVLLHHNNVHIIFLNLKKKHIVKKISEGKQDIGERMHKTVILWDANYDCEKTTTIRELDVHVALNGPIFLQILYIVLYA